MKNSIIRFISALLVLTSLSLALSSCASDDALEAISPEAIASESTTHEPEVTTTAETTAETTVETTTETTTEPETTAPETTTEVETEPVPEYVTIPRFYDLPEAEAIALLESYGLRCKSEYSYGTHKKSNVFSLKFSGKYDDDNYYIKSGSRVTLRVSLGGQPSKNAEAVNGSTIYLTFDDGPNPARLKEVLHILEKYDAKATFFLIGNLCAAQPESVKSIAAAGHAIGCHSMSHNYNAFYESGDSFRAELDSWEATVEGILGEVPDEKLFRFPGGSPKAETYGSATYGEFIEVLVDKGYKAYDWNLSNNDVFATTRNGDMTPDEYVKTSFLSLLDAYENRPKSPKIVLMHDINAYTVGMLEWAVELLVDRGYVFGTLDELGDEFYM